MSNQKSWDKPMPGESSKMFNRFIIYRDLPPEKRTLEKAWVKICRQMSENGIQDNEIKFPAIQKNSERWFWVERAELYDYHQHLKEVEKNEKDFTKQSQKAKRIFKKIMNWADKAIINIIDSDYALTTQIRMMQDVTNTAAKAHEQYRLACGKSTNNNFNDNKVSGTLDVKGFIGKENIHELSDEDLDLILSANEDNEDFTDKL